MTILLLPFSWIYGLISQVRAGLYRKGWMKGRKLPAPAVSVGNLSLGGTGKTPVVEYLARLLLKQGFQPIILSRGYGGSKEKTNLLVSDGRTIFASAGECGDEPYLLARKLPGVCIATGGNRHRSALLRPEWRGPGTIYLLDDGFQHLQVSRQLDLLLIDATDPVTDGRVIPAGRLREPAGAMRRADAVLITRSHLVPEPELETVERTIANWNPEAPVFHFAHHAVAVLNPIGQTRLPPACLQGRKVFVVAAIARPELFIRDLEGLGARVAGTAFYRDHHVLSRKEELQLKNRFQQAGAELLLTTEKDLVRLPAAVWESLPVLALEIAAEPQYPPLFLEWFETMLQELPERYESSACPPVRE